MEALRVALVACVVIHTVESAIQGVIVSCAEVVALGAGVVLFAGVEHVRLGWVTRCWVAAEFYSVSVV